jgi:transcriptional regulator of arginine metabolism
MKQQRHAVIQELLVKTVVTSQDELRQLAGRGFHVTQATLSWTFILVIE